MKQAEINNETQMSNKKIAMRVSFISIVVNIILSALKFVAGVLANSGAMISDAVHSASDVLSTFVVIIGVNISSKAKDSKHQYGHDRMECVAAIFLAVILFITGLGIGWSGVEKIVNASTTPIEVPGMLALVAAGISIVVKEWMYWTASIRCWIPPWMKRRRRKSGPLWRVTPRLRASLIYAPEPLGPAFTWI